MRTTKKTLTPQERFEHLCTVIGSEQFQKRQGLGSEVPFFICEFSPRDTIEMQDHCAKLVARLDRKETSVLVVNLYDLSLEIIQERGVLETILDQENEYSKDELKELLQSLLDSEEYLIPAIKEKVDEVKPATLFITGIGEVFPYIRSHSVLNNLQSVVKDIPTVMFFPGAYTQSPNGGSSLDLFELFHDDQYYRAFNIFDYKI